MSLRQKVDALKNEKTNYTFPAQAIDQAQSLHALSKDLYRDSKRFVYELLQNADDSPFNGNAVTVILKIFGNELVVAHSGKPFDARDLEGICSVNHGTKKNAPDKTGFKGLGFKAVFGQSQHVTVYSGGEYFRFDAGYAHPWNTGWGPDQQTWEVENERQFEYPWHIIPIYTEVSEIDPNIHAFLEQGPWQVATIIRLDNAADTKAAVMELASDPTMYLFLKHVSEIRFEVNGGRTIAIQEMDDGTSALLVNGTETARYRKRIVPLTVPVDLKAAIARDTNIPEKLKQADTVELTLACKIGDNGPTSVQSDNLPLYAYLPTDQRTFNLPVIVNAAFLTVASRETLHEDSVWNQWLFEKIPGELLRWIAELASGVYGNTAYHLLPSLQPSQNQLARSYNSGLDRARDTIPFILNPDGRLLKIKETLIDVTSMSTQHFVGADAVRTYVATGGLRDLAPNPFFYDPDTRGKLKNAGVEVFDWSDLPGLLGHATLAPQFTIAQNIELIRYLKQLHESRKVGQVSDAYLSSLPFLLNSRRELKKPKEVFFPTDDDNPAGSELSFIHPQLLEWLDTNGNMKQWLEDLGVVERTDLSYLEKMIVPNASSYMTPENAETTIRRMFHLFQKQELKREVLVKLGEDGFKLLTKGGNLLSSRECYFSSEYEPRLALETYIKEDIFLDPVYLIGDEPVSEWKRFFALLGVREGITPLKYPRLPVHELRGSGFHDLYFEMDDKKYKGVLNIFTSDAYTDLVTLYALSKISVNIELAKVFWKDVIAHVPINDINAPAVAFWGYPNRPGQDTGKQVANYIKAYVDYEPCLPATNGTISCAKDMFLNTEEIRKVAGKFLPVFDGPELTADWKAFFNFKTQLQLADHLAILTAISSQNANEENKAITQLVYEQLLDDRPNWSSEEEEQVRTWAATGLLADLNDQYTPCAALYHFIDGDAKVFEGAYRSIYLKKGLRKHPHLEKLLSLLQVNILRQAEFGVITEEMEEEVDLRKKLGEILPYWAKISEGEVAGLFEQRSYEMGEKLNRLQLYKARTLISTYGPGLQKPVNVHFNDPELYVKGNWQGNIVLMDLPAQLCAYFGTKGYEKEVEFMLRGSIEEIRAYFNERGISLPPEQDVTPVGTDPDRPGQTANSLHPPEKDYQGFCNRNKERNQALIAAAGGDAATLLLNGLEAQRPGGTLMIYHFSHLENAVSILKEGAIKSRARANFKDTAGSGIIAQTQEEKKMFARFYFRAGTPTQYYVENLGRADDSIAKIKSDPVCPVPVFFIFPLKEVMEQADWQVSIGSMAASYTVYGKDLETISKFDLEGVYKSKAELGYERFLMAAHQEFLVKDQLELDGLNFRLGVQDEAAKESLLAMLQDNSWESRIDILPELYNGDNVRAQLQVTEDKLQVDLSRHHDGTFVLQYEADASEIHVQGNITHEYRSDNITTVISKERLVLSGNLDRIRYNLFYHYKGQLWLLHTNQADNEFNTSYLRNQLQKWIGNGAPDAASLIAVLKQHPELAYWYAQSVKGQDNLTLEAHTLQVMDNYLRYFSDKEFLFTVPEFLLLLALHDIGKPAALALGDKALQHRETLRIIEKIAPMLPVTDGSIKKMMVLIDGDPLGGYLNTGTNVPLEDAFSIIEGMAQQLNIAPDELWPLLTMYYQCDAGGYPFLRNRLFARDQRGDLQFIADEDRLKFVPELETRFAALETHVKELCDEDN